MCRGVRPGVGVAVTGVGVGTRLGTVATAGLSLAVSTVASEDREPVVLTLLVCRLVAGRSMGVGPRLPLLPRGKEQVDDVGHGGREADGPGDLVEPVPVQAVTAGREQPVEDRGSHEDTREHLDGDRLAVAAAVHGDGDRHGPAGRSLGTAGRGVRPLDAGLETGQRLLEDADATLEAAVVATAPVARRPRGLGVLGAVDGVGHLLHAGGVGLGGLLGRSPLAGRLVGVQTVRDRLSGLPDLGGGALLGEDLLHPGGQLLELGPVVGEDRLGLLAGDADDGVGATLAEVVDENVVVRGVAGHDGVLSGRVMRSGMESQVTTTSSYIAAIIT